MYPRRVRKAQAEPRRAGKDMYVYNIYIYIYIYIYNTYYIVGRTDPNRTVPMNFRRNRNKPNRTGSLLLLLGCTRMFD